MPQRQPPARTALSVDVVTASLLLLVRCYRLVQLPPDPDDSTRVLRKPDTGAPGFAVASHGPAWHDGPGTGTAPRRRDALPNRLGTVRRCAGHRGARRAGHHD